MRHGDTLIAITIIDTIDFVSAILYGILLIIMHIAYAE